MSRNGTPMQRLRDRLRVSPAPERIEYFRERGVEQQAEGAVVVAEAAGAAVDGLADGTTAFTGLNVGGTNVKPFLDKTDGAKLTDSTGLDGSVVVPTTLASGAANQVITLSGATVGLPAATQTTVLSLAVTTIAGEVVDLFAQFAHLEISDASVNPQLVGFWKRGATVVPASAAVKRGLDVTRAADLARYVMAEGGMTVVGTDIPGAGAHTYDLVATALVAASATNPAARLLTSTRP